MIVNALKSQLKPWLGWRADDDDILAHLPADAEPQPVAQLMLPEGMHAHEDVRGVMWMHVLSDRWTTCQRLVQHRVGSHTGC